MSALKSPCINMQLKFLFSIPGRLRLQSKLRASSRNSPFFKREIFRAIIKTIIPAQLPYVCKFVFHALNCRRVFRVVSRCMDTFLVMWPGGLHSVTDEKATGIDYTFPRILNPRFTPSTPGIPRGEFSGGVKGDNHRHMRHTEGMRSWVCSARFVQFYPRARRMQKPNLCIVRGS